MNKKVIFLFLVSFIIFALSTYSLLYLKPTPKPQKQIGVNTLISENIGGEFDLIDVDGKPFNQEDLKGHYSLIYFGYSCCPDTCPTTLGKITTILNELSPEELSIIKTYFITLDPKRDDGTQLKNFIKNFHPSIVALTGTEEQIKKASNAYKIYYATHKPKENEGHYLIDHTSLIYFMDPNGKSISFFAYNASPEEISQEIRRKLALKRD